MMMSRAVWIVVSVLLLSGVTERAEAQMQIGPQASVGSDSGFGLGARLLFPLLVSPLGLEGTFDANYFFGGGTGVDSWVDANANVRIPVPLARDFSTRVGAGLNVGFISVETPGPSTDTETEFGLNLLAAIGSRGGRFSPFAELRAVLGGAEQVVLTGGFTVGGAR